MDSSQLDMPLDMSPGLGVIIAQLLGVCSKGVKNHGFIPSQNERRKREVSRYEEV